ncbi:hypothetical protein [Halosimplex sp. J119]
MASESSDDAAVHASVPADVAAWLDRKADDLGVDRETVVVQLLASYRAAEELGDESVSTALEPDVESEVRDVLAERLPDIADAVAEQFDADAAVDIGAVEEGLSAEIDRIEADFAEKIGDVRERVVQVKREADAKADADHTHPEFGELATLSTAVDDLESALDGLEYRVEDDSAGEVDDRLDEIEDRVAEIEQATDHLDEIEERLRTVAWVVSDLREAEQARSGRADAVERLKTTAAELDADRAVCENCREPVDIALLHEPKCPHCDATVSDVQLPSGLFGKPKLTVARRLEAGDEAETDRSNVPDAAQRE